MKPKWFQEIESLYFWNLWCFHGKFWSFWWFFFFVTWFEAPKPVVFDQNSSWAGFQIVPITFFCFIPQKRFLKEPLRGIPFVWVLSFLCLNVVENLYRPKDQTLSFIVRVVVVVVGGTSVGKTLFKERGTQKLSAGYLEKLSPKSKPPLLYNDVFFYLTNNCQNGLNFQMTQKIL